MLENRSAPTSLLFSTNEPTNHLAERSLSDMASIKSANPSQQQLSTNTSNGISLSTGSSSSELINSRFNELAKKILAELSQSQYSKEFFQALDCIIKEPSSKSPMLKGISAARKGANQLNGGFSDRKRINRRRIRVSDNSQNSSTSELPLSNTSNNNQKSITRHQSINRQQLVSSLTLVNGQKSIIPVMCAVENGNGGPKGSATQSSASQVNQGANRLTRSATSAGEMLTKLKTNLSRLTTTGHQAVQRQVTASKTSGSTNGAKMAHSTSEKSMKRLKANSFDQQDNIESSDGQEEEEEEIAFDGDFELDEEGYSGEEEQEKFSQPLNYSMPNHSSQPRAAHQSPPLVKSKTVTDASNLRKIIRSTAETSQVQQRSAPKPLQQRQSQPKNQIPQSLLTTANQMLHPDKSHHHPVTRSHTITSTKGVAAHLEKLAQERSGFTKNSSSASGGSYHNKEPRSMVFNRRDMGSLYKPNMNYSTSVLGNHRLSDDDEIIIIPTQSPSLMSTSPDGDMADEASERFSISRTKSFWEKLSKGNSKHGSLPNEEGSDSLVLTHNNNNNNNSNTTNNNNRSNTTSATGAHNIYDKPLAKGVNQNPLDRMDSTGGSNSNYNGSSSGDENFTSYTNPNPTIRHLQEMNRQNKFRQTR